MASYRELKGKDPSSVDLVKKIEQVHNNFTRRFCVQTLHSDIFSTVCSESPLKTDHSPFGFFFLFV